MGSQLSNFFRNGYTRTTFQMKMMEALLVLALTGVCVNGLPYSLDNLQKLMDDLQKQLNVHKGVSNVEVTQLTAGNQLPTDEIIVAAGYPAETHQVTTEDGYILTLHRIPYAKNTRHQGDDTKRPVVFLQHGLLCSSADWVLSTPSKALGFILANAGYDVWMGNYRGNTYSRNHTHLDPDEKGGDFWKFTWDEMAKHDLPSQIEKVLEVSGAEKLQYIGHSMGTTGFMAMHHYRKDVAQKIRLAHLLSPVAYMSHMESPIKYLVDPIVGTLLVNMLGVGEFLPSNWLIDWMADKVCNQNGPQVLCGNVLFSICGHDEAQLNHTLLPTIIHHTPAGASSQTVLHYSQEIHSGKFRGYDWGNEEDNLKHHGSEGIPTYSLSDVKTPVSIHYGQNDWLASLEDVLQAVTELPNIVKGMDHKVDYPNWNHLDFLWAIDADKLVYEPLVKDMQFCQENDCRI